MSTSSWVGFAALVVATISSTIFMVIYSLRGNWWHPAADDPHGEHRAHLGYFTLCLAVTFWVFVFRPVFDPEVFGWVRSVLFWTVALNVAWRLRLLVRRPRPHRVH